MLSPHSCIGTLHRSDQRGCCLGWCQAWSRLFGRSRRFDRCVGSSRRREPALRGWSSTMSSINTDNVRTITTLQFPFLTLSVIFWLIFSSYSEAEFYFIVIVFIVCLRYLNQKNPPTFPDPIEPVTANISPFFRFKLMSFSTGVTHRLVKKRPASPLGWPLALFSCLILSKSSPVPWTTDKCYVPPFTHTDVYCMFCGSDLNHILLIKDILGFKADKHCVDLNWSDHNFTSSQEAVTFSRSRSVMLRSYSNNLYSSLLRNSLRM